MVSYLNILDEVLENGEWKEPAREGMPRTKSVFGIQLKHDLQKGFPLITTRKIHFKGVITELLWFLKGDTNIKYLIDNGCNIWNEDAYNFYLKNCKDNSIPEDKRLEYGQFLIALKENDICGYLPNYKYGDCGKIYGHHWRNWQGFIDSGWQTEIEGNILKSGTLQSTDQISELINNLRSNPESRRHIVTSWNPTTLDEQALPACHMGFQMNCRKLDLQERIKICNPTLVYYSDIDAEIKCNVLNMPKYKLDCRVNQRSSDSALGLPFNIASYALLVHIIAKLCNMIPGNLIFDIGDAHIYENQIPMIEEQLQRAPKDLPILKFSNESYKASTDWTKLNIEAFLDELHPGNFEVINYESHPAIKIPLSTGLNIKNEK